MVEVVTTVGPKGQILVPKILRNEYGIDPKDKVVLKEEKEGILIKKQHTDAVNVFRSIAKGLPKVKKIDIFFHEKELHEKWLKARNK